MTCEESIQGTVDADMAVQEGILILVMQEEVKGQRRGAVGNIDANIGGTGGSEDIEIKDISSFGVPRGSGEGAVGNTDAGGSSSSSRSSSRSARLTTGHGGTVDADIGGAGKDTDIGDARGSEGGAGGDTDIGGTGGSEGIELEDVGSFGVPRGSGGGAVGNIDVDIGGTGGSEGIELEILVVLEFLGAAERVLCGILMLVEALAGVKTNYRSWRF
ncbi:hypothetical protein GH714_018908 [Hevea brasiliensis]|uniref:Uncharacterized protein n=1 Tax=Hevea brasiliensis TaxID=3981 RepID=A0A6A6KTJ0_HEVBR|nr:hypothetical protein GH714_018908 [Hevea brasiliensis]